MVDVYLVAFVKRSKNRLKILQLLTNKEKSQAELHLGSGLYRTHARRTLLELEEKGLVICLNPRDRIGRLYQITGDGKEVLKRL